MSATHAAPGLAPVPCLADAGACLVCAALDRDGPGYREDFRRLFFPAEFADAPPPPAAPDPPPPAAGPLAGDLVEALAHRVGADRAAKWVAARLGVDCGCAARQAAINRIHASIRRFLAR